MSKPQSENVLPRQVDPRKFAQQGVELKGTVAISALKRLSEALASTDGEVVLELSFGINEEHKRILTGTAQATVEVICQRCLDITPLTLEGNLSLAMVWSEEQAENLPKHLDPWIIGEGAADLYDIIEEELLLNLPMVSYHKEACVDKANFSSGEAVEEEVESVPNPFSVLEQLKGSPK